MARTNVHKAPWLHPEGCQLQCSPHHADAGLGDWILKHGAAAHRQSGEPVCPAAAQPLNRHGLWRPLAQMWKHQFNCGSSCSPFFAPHPPPVPVPPSPAVICSRQPHEGRLLQQHHGWRLVEQHAHEGGHQNTCAKGSSHVVTQRSQHAWGGGCMQQDGLALLQRGQV